MQINKILKSNLFLVNHVYSFLFSLLGSMIIFSIFYISMPKPQKFGVVNLTAIVRDFINTESKENKSKEILTKEVKQFGASLEQTIKKVSIENNVILLPSQAVMSGSQDYTPLIKQKMKLLIQVK